MRLIQNSKQKIQHVVNYVYNFSTGQVGGAICSGLPTIYYLQMILGPVMGSAIAFSLSIPVGGGTAIIMVYAAEKDNKKLIEQLEVKLAEKKGKYEKAQVEYLKTKGVFEYFDLKQIKTKNILTESYTTTEYTAAIFLLLKNIFLKLSESKPITPEDLQIKSTIHPISISTRFTGTARARPEDEFEKICRHFEAKTPKTEDKEAKASEIKENTALSEDKNSAKKAPGFFKKFGLFLWDSTALSRAVMMAYLAMISYYLDFTFEETGMNSWAAWSSSIFLGAVISTFIGYFNSAPSRDEIADLQDSIAAFHNTSLELEVAESRLKHATGELEKLNTTNLETLFNSIRMKPPQQITLGFLSESLKIFDQDSKSRRRHRTEFKSLPTSTSTTFFPPTAATPLLHSAIELRNINSDDPTPAPASQSSRCAIV